MNEFLLCNYQKSVCEHSSDFYHNSTCIYCMYYIQLLHAFSSEVMCNFYPLHSHTERPNSPYLNSEFLLPSVGETNGLKYKLSWGFISPYILLFVLHSFSVRVFRRKFKLISQCWGGIETMISPSTPIPRSVFLSATFHKSSVAKNEKFCQATGQSNLANGMEDCSTGHSAVMWNYCRAASRLILTGR